MTPSARVEAAIQILDLVLAGEASEKVLTRWGRTNRYAGSGDRAAIRDHVFGAIRCKRSYGYLGGGDSGRALMIGWARSSGMDCNILFSGEKYAPDVLNEIEKIQHNLSEAPRLVQLDCPDWLLPLLDNDLGTQADAVLASLQKRAPVFLRVNSAKSSLSAVQEILSETEIDTKVHPLSETALEVVTHPRRVAQSRAYHSGMVELQDVTSQAVVDYLPLRDGDKVLDYCAGGGGKSLAMVAKADIDLTAHDIDQTRMKDLPARVLRAGAAISISEGADLGTCEYDLVLCDVPCSGSGSWRRSPDAKWALTPDRLDQLVETQASVLAEAQRFVSDTGVLAYVTCSLFDMENSAQIGDFLTVYKEWKLLHSRRWLPLDGGDGFYVALLKRYNVL